MSKIEDLSVLVALREWRDYSDPERWGREEHRLAAAVDARFAPAVPAGPVDTEERRESAGDIVLAVECECRDRCGQAERERDEARAEMERAREEAEAHRLNAEQQDRRARGYLAELERVRTTLAEAVRQFYEHGHPGYPALRSCWVRVSTVERWRAVLAGEQPEILPETCDECETTGQNCRLHRGPEWTGEQPEIHTGGVVPNPVAPQGCDDCSVEPGETHRYAGCPGAGDSVLMRTLSGGCVIPAETLRQLSAGEQPEVPPC